MLTIYNNIHNKSLLGDIDNSLYIEYIKVIIRIITIT